MVSTLELFLKILLPIVFVRLSLITEYPCTCHSTCMKFLHRNRPFRNSNISTFLSEWNQELNISCELSTTIRTPLKGNYVIRTLSLQKEKLKCCFLRSSTRRGKFKGLNDRLRNTNLWWNKQVIWHTSVSIAFHPKNELLIIFIDSEMKINLAAEIDDRWSSQDDLAFEANNNTVINVFSRRFFSVLGLVISSVRVHIAK